MIVSDGSALTLAYPSTQTMPRWKVAETKICGIWSLLITSHEMQLMVWYLQRERASNSPRRMGMINLKETLGRGSSYLPGSLCNYPLNNNRLDVGLDRYVEASVGLG